MMQFDRNWINKIMGGKGDPVMRDTKTPAQQRVINSKNMRQMFGDWDRDGVINALDCQPRNPNRHSAFPGVSPDKYRVTDDSYFLGKQASDKAMFKKKMEDIWSDD